MLSIRAALLVAMFLLVSHLQGPAQAYLDPNTGSMALQLLLAAIVGLLATLRVYRDRLKAFLFRKFAQRHSGRSEPE
jgi:hypothetical protein